MNAGVVSAWDDSNLRIWENPWRLMLAVNTAVIVGVFLHKIALPPYVPYIHLLVDYHFGFTKRALIGAVVGLFTVEGAGVAGVRARRRDLADHARPVRPAVSARRSDSPTKHLPLFVFMAGSPFFLKNFMHTLGHFDIYGCALAIAAADSGAFGLLTCCWPRRSRSSSC